MKCNFFKPLFLMLPGMLLASGAADFMSERDGGWREKPEVQNGEIVFTEKIPRVISTATFKVDPEATYRLSGKFRRTAPDGGKNLLFFGAEALTEKGRAIGSPTVFIYPGTETELVADMPKGAISATVKDASKWNTKSNACVIAFNAENNLADLPNFQYSPNIKQIEEKDGNWLITLAGPTSTGFKAGTKVRQHSHGPGRCYFAASYRQVAGEEWKEVSGTISGIAEHGAPLNKWWKGTASAKVIISSAPGVAFKDIRLEKINGQIDLIAMPETKPPPVPKVDPLEGLYEKYAAEINRPLPRPRLLFTNEMFADMRRPLAENALLKNSFDQLCKKIDAYPEEVNEETFKKVFWAKDKFGPTAMRAAFAYKITGEKKYREKAIAILKYASSWYNRQYAAEEPVDWTSFSRISALCAYDWLYPEMTESEQLEIGRELLAHIVKAQDAAWIRKSGMQNKGEGISDWNSSFYGTPLLKFYAGLVFCNTGINDAAAAKFLADGLRDHIRMLDYRAKMAGADGGSNCATLGYAFGDAPVCEWIFYYTWQTLTGHNIAADFPANGLLPHWLFYATFSGRNEELLEHGSGSAWHLDNRVRMNLRYLAQYRNFYPNQSTTKFIDYFISTQDEFKDDQHVYASGTWSHNGYFPWLPFKYNYTRQADYRPDQALFASLPKACFFKNLGQTYMFSGRDRDSTYALFTCGSKTPAHKQYDENNFIIYKSGFLALDSGTRSASGYKDWLDDMWHDNNYNTASIAHNVVTIRMEGETFSGWPEQKYAITNHGGMYKTTGGVVKAFENNDLYTYVSGDSTACYRPEKCRKMIRQFVFIRPDFFVVCDTVESVEKGQLKTWLLHSQNEPVESGDQFRFDEGQGRLFCRTFLPVDFKREKIGGPGKEFWVDGKNYPMGKTRMEEYAKRGIINPLWGNWRIELTANKPAESVRFLNLIQVGMSGELKEMVRSDYVKNGTREGVTFTYENTKYTVLFDADGSGGWFQAVRNGQVILEKDLNKG